jgi:single-strand selective monofunctional uracil DNA glycosylase
LIEAALRLRGAVERLSFSSPVACVYNPLRYAWGPHERYLALGGKGPKRILFLGMNPGPWGMAQVGVPFGEIKLVRDWLGIEEPVGKPDPEHPLRPVEGFACARSEVSGRRLWGLFAERFGTANRFFRDHFVVNYCPLLFLSERGSNITPDHLSAREREPLLRCCDEHLRRVADTLAPEWVVGIGRFAEERAASTLAGRACGIAGIPHPSPANPAANQGWAEAAESRLCRLGIWPRALRL